MPEQPQTIQKTIDQTEQGIRLDAFLATLTGVTRSQAQRLVERELVLLNGEKPKKAGMKLSAGDTLTVTLPPPEPLEAVAVEMPLAIVYQDADLAVINKPRGLVVHPAAGHAEDTLVNGLLYALTDLSGIGGTLRPGIVHRLDKDTTGLLVVAKNDEAHVSLSAQIKEKSAVREYLALVEGHIKLDEGMVDAPIARDPRDRKRMAIVPGGRAARTHYTVLERFANTTLLRLRLETGRTHQIRVHMKSLGHPVCGDPLYGFEKTGALKGAARSNCPLMLHACALTLTQPHSGERLHFEAEPPADFTAVLNCQRGG